ncbi:hypothetical protein KGY71_07345 [Candidatus Bipolaricaulota bacterium]|nr:hypothetical protein [Candidatus Bipolaricaulota bacterium]
MNRVLLLLLVAGLVAGVALVSVDFTETETVAPQEDSQTQESISEVEEEPPPEDEAGNYTGLKSLDLKVDYVDDDTEVTTRYRVRKPETDEEDLRIDTTREDGSKMILILRQSQDEGWLKEYSSDRWAHVTGLAFTQTWRTRGDAYLNYKKEDWKAMEGEETRIEREDGTIVTAYDVRVNREIPDSVFTPD